MFASESLPHWSLVIDHWQLGLKERRQDKGIRKKPFIFQAKAVPYKGASPALCRPGYNPENAKETQSPQIGTPQVGIPRLSSQFAHFSLQLGLHLLLALVIYLVFDLGKVFKYGSD